MKNEQSVSILDRLLEPVSRSLNPASAKALAEMEADPVAAERVSVLAEKCNEGTLTPTEEREYETYVHAGNLIAILKAKARLYLKRHATS
ncbi:MAG: hypothetical protein KIS67_28530 [Verrucomicrobiae bacterium]|nr:hypothetical protein [Verrucomicrobiae bacterium]